jgi:hypothetical protein
LPEGDASDEEYFISQALIALPVLGVSVLRAVTTARAAGEVEAAPGVEDRLSRFVLLNRAEGRAAYAIERDGEFTVLTGSHVRAQHTGSGSYGALRVRLEKDGAIDASAEPAVMSKNQVFASPSAAASVVAGRAANGRVSWVEEATGMTYGDWQNRDLEVVLTPSV